MASNEKLLLLRWRETEGCLLTIFNGQVKNVMWTLPSWYTVCPRSSDPFYKVPYYIKWVTTSWTYGTCKAVSRALYMYSCILYLIILVWYKVDPLPELYWIIQYTASITIVYIKNLYLFIKNLKISSYKEISSWLQKVYYFGSTEWF